jgi:beta-galactosidase
MGGLPFWLLQLNPDVKLRTNDPKFMGYVDRFLNQLYSRLSKHLVTSSNFLIKFFWTFSLT